MRLTNIFLFIILFNSVLLIPISYSFTEEDIFTSKELEIDMTVLAGLNIYGASKPLNWVEATFNYYPKDSYHQKIIRESHIPNYYKKTDTDLNFKVENVQNELSIKSNYIIRTQNVYKEITKEIPFPSTFPKELDIYLKETELIDQTPEIKATASTIASGKNDLFEVSQEVAYWVINNIKYDLNSITEDSSQKASWVMKNRQGVCDELAIVYIALMRSLGIPARFVTGISYSNLAIFENPWSPHAWAEVYFPDYGWVPFDLTYQQMGFLDASHVQFQALENISNIQTNYQWKGYNLDEIKVDLKQTEFDMKIVNYFGKVSQGYDIAVSVTNEAVGIGSYNVLKINLKNNKNYYVSSLLDLSMPTEVLTKTYRLPVYLKPNEEKTLYVLLEVENSLSSKYIYTMPISVYTPFGNMYSTSFTVATNFDKVSLKQVNSLINHNSKDLSTNKIILNCNFEKEEVLLNQNNEFVCIIKNEGNIYLKDGQICFDLDSENKDCDSLSLEIGSSKTVTKKFSSTDLGNHIVETEIEFDTYNKKQSYGFMVLDRPHIEIASIDIGDIKIGEDVELKVVLRKISNSVPQNIDLRIEINDNVFNWEVDKINQNTEFTIPFSSYLLKKGENKISAFIMWEDIEKGQFFAEKISIKNIEKYGFFDSFKSWFYRLGN